VRSHEVPFVLEHEQVVGWLRYERLTAVPEKLYGPTIGSSYQYQGLALAKQFRR
jgi:dCTP deaminase